MPAASFGSFTLAGPAATRAFGRALAPLLEPGDVILLSGGIGAGKTELARAIIQARLDACGRLEDVPSPTYTLVQVYEDDHGEIWHVDLYRLTGPEEAAELGLLDAFDTALCLVEWPDRLGSHAPSGALSVALEPSADGASRHVHLTSDRADWSRRLAAVTEDLPDG